MSKLVRDKIPEIIEKSGKIPIYHKVSKKEMLDLLTDKLKEELLELQNAKTKEEKFEEQADVWEVMDAIRKAFYLKVNLPEWAEIYQIQNKKRRERGGFSKRIVLDEVKDNE